MDEIETPPGASALMESTRSIGYSFETAISDILDNSISAKASNIWIQSIPSENPHVSILDDGIGLTLSELKESMRYGVDPNELRSELDLGRFGLGMKMASLSQCRCLTVISKTVDGIYACRWDLDRVIQTNQWTLQILFENEVSSAPQFDKLKNLKHGTLVLWENLDRIKERAMSITDSMTETIVLCRNHIGLVFHRFMEDKKNPLQIFFNNEKILSKDPFLTNNSLTANLPEQTIIIQGQKVIVKPYVLPPESKLKPSDIEHMGGLQRRLQGFWVYRNKRLIIPGTWFRLSCSKELTKLARVRVDIPNTLDSVWDIDVKKSTATIPAQFQDEFTKVLDRVIEKSEKKYKFKGRKKSTDDINFVWNKITLNQINSYKINFDHPLIKSCLDCIDDETKSSVLQILKLIEESLPYQDIYNSMAEAKLARKETTKVDLEEMYSSALRMLNIGISLDIIAKTEPFMNYPDIIDKLRKFKEA